MSASKTITLACDAPGCAATYTTSDPAANAADLRASAHDDGWRSPDWGPDAYNSSPTSADICPDHVRAAVAAWLTTIHPA